MNAYDAAINYDAAIDYDGEESPVPAQQGGMMYARPRAPVAVAGYEDEEMLILLLTMELLISD